MITTKILRDIKQLRELLSPMGASLPPLVLPLLDSLENQTESIQGIEQLTMSQEDEEVHHG